MNQITARSQSFRMNDKLKKSARQIMKHLSISIQIDKHLNLTPFVNKQQQTE